MRDCYKTLSEREICDWLSEWLKWAKENNCTRTDEYQVTKYSLEKIMECRKAEVELATIKKSLGLD